MTIICQSNFHIRIGDLPTALTTEHERPCTGIAVRPSFNGNDEHSPGVLKSTASKLILELFFLIIIHGLRGMRNLSDLVNWTWTSMIQKSLFSNFWKDTALPLRSTTFSWEEELTKTSVVGCRSCLSAVALTKSSIASPSTSLLHLPTT